MLFGTRLHKKNVLCSNGSSCSYGNKLVRLQPPGAVKKHLLSKMIDTCNLVVWVCVNKNENLHIWKVVVYVWLEKLRNC